MVAGHATSVSLEPAFWDALKDLAERRRLSINQLVGAIDGDRDAQSGNLSSAVRIAVLAAARAGELAPGPTGPSPAPAPSADPSA